MNPSMSRMLSGACALLLVGLSMLPVASAADGGERSVSALRKDVQAAERRFYDLYNKYTTDSRQKITCENSASTGTKLASRKCATVGEKRARAQEAEMLLSSMQSNDGLTGAANDQNAASRPAAASPSPNAAPAAPTGPASAAAGSTAEALEAENQRQDFRGNAQALIARHPDLRQAAEEYAAAKARLAAAQGGSASR